MYRILLLTLYLIKAIIKDYYWEKHQRDRGARLDTVNSLIRETIKLRRKNDTN